MDAKGKVALTTVAFLLLVVSLALEVQARAQQEYFVFDQEFSEKSHSPTTSSVLKQSDHELPDKVYTFLAPETNLTKTVHFEGKWMYYIYVEIVTPHNCTMKIEILDIEGGERLYEIFENNVSYEPEYLRSYEVPFGVAFSGTYNVTFAVKSDQNVNINIRIEQGPLALHDKMSAEAIQNMIFHEVFVFDKVDNGERVDYSIDLQEDTMYDIYIGRVSSVSEEIAKTLPYLVKMSMEIQDPNDVSFSLYSDHEMAGVDDVDKTFFGTSVNGSHSLNITLSCEVNHANIALAVVKDHQISDNTEENDDSTSDGTSSSSDGSSSGNLELDLFKDTATGDVNDSTYSLPEEMTIGTITTVGGTLGTMIITLIIHRKKNAVQLNA